MNDEDILGCEYRPAYNMKTSPIPLDFKIARFTSVDLRIDSDDTPYIRSLNPIKEMEVELVFEKTDIEEICISCSNADIEVVAYNKEEPVRFILYKAKKSGREKISEHRIKYLGTNLLEINLDCCLLI